MLVLYVLQPPAVLLTRIIIFTSGVHATERDLVQADGQGNWKLINYL